MCGFLESRMCVQVGVGVGGGANVCVGVGVGGCFSHSVRVCPCQFVP